MSAQLHNLNDTDELTLDRAHTIAAPSLAIDLGGTGLRSALVHEDGSVKDAVREDTPRESSAIVPRLQQIIDARWRQGPLASVGLAVTGSVKNGLVRSNNLGWTWEPVERNLNGRGIPLVVVNDMAAAAVAEHRFGAGQGVQDLLVLTVSTGIGSGMVSGGVLRRGGHGVAGDVGHMTLNHEGPLCGCGRRGCWELYASGSAHRRRIREAYTGGAWLNLDKEPSVAEVTQMAEDGNRAAAALVKQAAHYLGLGIASLAKVLDPEMVVFMGGFAVNTWHLLEKWVESEILEHMLACDIALRCTTLGDNAGLMGAMALSRDALFEKGTPKDS